MNWKVETNKEGKPKSAPRCMVRKRGNKGPEMEGQNVLGPNLLSIGNSHSPRGQGKKTARILMEGHAIDRRKNIWGRPQNSKFFTRPPPTQQKQTLGGLK